MGKEIVIGFVGVILGFVFNGLIKEKWKNILQNESEKLKNKLSAELTTLQSNLTAQREKDNIKFSKFHEKKFEVYEELYRLMNSYFIDLTIFCNPSSYINEREKVEEFKNSSFKKLLSSQKKLLVYFDNKKIYLNESIIEKTTNFLEVSNQSFESNYLIMFFEKLKSKPNNELYQDAYNAYEDLKIKLIPIKLEIEKILKEELHYKYE